MGAGTVGRDALRILVRTTVCLSLFTAGGAIVATAGVSAASSKPTIAGLQASPAAVEGGQPTTIEASVSGATTCTLSSAKPIGGLPATFPCEGAPAQVERSVTPAGPAKEKSLSYKLTLAASGPGGTSRAKLALPVSPAALHAVAVSASGAFSCALPATSRPLCWGEDRWRQLGFWLSAVKDREIPEEVGVSDVAQIATGVSHTCAELEGGGAECWGRGDVGQNGDGFSDEETDPPGPVSTLTEALEIGAGEDHACAVLIDGRLECWGENRNGELGQPASLRRSYRPLPVEGVTEAVQVAVGLDTTCVLLASGHVECFGWGGGGELGDGQSGGEYHSYTPVEVQGLSNATAIAAGDSSNCALLQTGRVECWGAQMGDGESASSDVPVEISGIEGATAVAAGHFDGCAVLASGRIACWGYNGAGELGDGSTQSAYSAVEVSGIETATQVSTGTFHTCAVLEDGRVECWGQNTYGQLGIGSTKGSLVPVAVLAP